MASTEESRLNIFCHRESAAWAPKPRELPVTLVTGFLGSGKTALLRHILSNTSNLRVAAAVNDAAAVNIDADLITKLQKGRAGGGQVLELSNGCMCCSTGGESDFASAVLKVLQECDVGKVGPCPPLPPTQPAATTAGPARAPATALPTHQRPQGSSRSVPPPPRCLASIHPAKSVCWRSGARGNNGAHTTAVRR